MKQVNETLPSNEQRMTTLPLQLPPEILDLKAPSPQNDDAFGKQKNLRIFKYESSTWPKYTVWKNVLYFSRILTP